MPDPFSLTMLGIYFPSEFKLQPFLSADLGSNNSGYYDLQAVLTHQGRSSSSGHYVAWVKRKEGNLFLSRFWMAFNKDDLTKPELHFVSLRHFIWSVLMLKNMNWFFTVFWTDEWVKFDDDKVSVVSPEDILKLSGGGDWHIAYVLLYGPRRLEILV